MSFGPEQWRQPCTCVAAGVARVGGGAGGAAAAAADKNLGAPAAVHSRLLGVVRREPVLHHVRRRRPPWHTPVEPRCLLRPPAAAPELRPLVDLDLVVLCAAYISNIHTHKKKKKGIINFLKQKE